MAYKYCVAVNSGKGFINARERMEFDLSGHPGNVCGGSESKFLELWKECKGGRYDFMTIDLRKLRVFKNLDKLVYDDFNSTPQDSEEPKLSQHDPKTKLEDDTNENKM